VADLHGRTAQQFVEALARLGDLATVSSPEPSAPRDVRVYVDGLWFSLGLRAPATADAVGRLDVSLLQDQVLGPLLGIDDPRTNQRIEFAGGIRGTRYLEEAVDSGRAAVAFSLHPVTVDQLMDISDAGQIMPPKSTWFEPKLRDGLFMHVF
jgi:uncharacterized protein (DUF1015 family)